MGKRFVILGLITALVLVPVLGCRKESKEVVCYTAVDQEYAEQVFSAFEAETGIHVLPVYDTEAAKTTGLVNRLLAEKSAPACDVFWSNETTQMALLARQEVLDKLPQGAADGILARYRDPEGQWAGHAARFRVLLFNRGALSGPMPSSVMDLASDAYPRGSVGMAMPLFGTTAAHAAALYAVLGADKARSFYEQVHKAGVRIVDGNATVRDLVGQGVLQWGITDSDDALVAIRRGDPVSVVVPDQEGMGTLVIPSSVAMVRGAPHEEAAARLARFLLSEKVETMLMDAGYCQLSTRQEGGIAPLTGTPIKGMDVSADALQQAMQTSQADLATIFGG